MMPPEKRLQAARWLVARALLAVGVPLRLHSPDRELLEKTILPYFAAREEFRKILFVGCDWYTKQYERSFRDRAYTTIDVDPARRAFGAKRHIVGSMARLKDHVSAGELDLILCNGVFGWGLDGRDEAAQAFAAAHSALRENGAFVLGSDDVPEHRPFDPADLDELRRFSRWTFPPPNATRHVVESNRHVYDFFTRR